MPFKLFLGPECPIKVRTFDACHDTLCAPYCQEDCFLAANCIEALRGSSVPQPPHLTVSVMENPRRALQQSLVYLDYPLYQEIWTKRCKEVRYWILVKDNHLKMRVCFPACDNPGPLSTDYPV